MTLFKYILVQMFAYALDMGSFLVFAFFLDGQHVLANVFGKIVAGFFAFFLHRHFTFQSIEISRYQQAVRYFTLLLINIPISSAVFTALLYFIDVPTLAKFISDVACLALTYWISKILIFPSKTSP